MPFLHFGMDTAVLRFDTTPLVFFIAKCKGWRRVGSSTSPLMPTCGCYNRETTRYVKPTQAATNQMYAAAQICPGGGLKTRAWSARIPQSAFKSAYLGEKRTLGAQLRPKPGLAASHPVDPISQQRKAENCTRQDEQVLN